MLPPRLRPAASHADRPSPVYLRLDPGEILKTARRLTRRVSERFEGSNLSRVCAELEHVVAETDRHCLWIVRPMISLRVDPERILTRAEGGDTPSSPARTLTPFELVRYLDYASEMLAVIGKTAALYAQYLADAVVLASVNEIEQLTTNLSQKIWQKITTVDVYRQREARG